MFLLKWFRTFKKLPLNSIIYWLKESAQSVDYGDKSAYFKIDGITIRYSDHLATTSSGVLHIIRLDHEYLAFTNSFKYPKAFNDVKELKRFIEDFIFIYKCFHKELIPTLDDIIECKKTKIIKTTNISEKKSILDNPSVQKIINSVPEEFKIPTVLRYITHFSLEMQDIMWDYCKVHPENKSKVMDFINTNYNNSKSAKIRHWKLFVKENE